MANGPNWFIGLPVDAGELPAGLMDSIPPGLRRFHADDLHVTVAFLGAVGPEAARAAWARVADIDAGPLRVQTGPLAGFGRPARPSAYGLELDRGGDALAEFIGRWRDPLRAAAGVGPEGRDVRPHVTLARPPRRGGRTIRARADAWLARTAPAPATLTFARIALYTRADAGDERLFRRVGETALAAPAARDAAEGGTAP